MALFLELLTAVIRAALVLVGDGLIHHHILTPEQVGRMLGPFSATVAGWLIIAGSLAWSFVNKWKTHKVKRASKTRAWRVNA